MTLPYVVGREDPTPTLQLHGVTRSFGTSGHGRVAALGPVDLTLRQSEFVAIVGPSGCGKSTLLRVAAGLLRPTSGRIDRAAESEASFVFQEPALLPWRSVRRNCAVPLELTGVPRSERAARVLEALELVGLRSWAGFYPHQLSGGMKMRVALARALVVDAAVVYFDEPFSAIDELTREVLNEQLGLLWAQRRFAGLFVTHNISEAVFLAERVLVMSERPGMFVGEIQVPFPFPRESWLRTTEDFVSVERSVSALLRSRRAQGDPRATSDVRPAEVGRG